MKASHDSGIITRIRYPLADRDEPKRHEFGVLQRKEYTMIELDLAD